MNVKRLLMNLPTNINNLLHTFDEVARKLRIPCYLVGGFCRDLFLGWENFDVDLVVEGDGVKFADFVGKMVGGEIKNYEQFMTSTIQFPDGVRVDISTARAETYPYPASLPIIEKSTIYEDLARRDFTINSIAIQLYPEIGEVLDQFSGIQDIQNKVIKVLHSRSFHDDPTRALRAARFAARLGFEIDGWTQGLIKCAIEEGVFELLSRERIRDEFILILGEEKRWNVVKQLKEMNLLRYIHPALYPYGECRELFRCISNSLKERISSTPIYGEWLVFLIALLQPLSPPVRKELVDSLKLARREREIIRAADLVNPLLNFLRSEEAHNPVVLYERLNPLPLEVLIFLLAKVEFSGEKQVKEKLTTYLNRLRGTKVLLTGEDLQRLSFKPGPIYKKIFESLLHARLEGKVKTWEDEVKYVVDNFSP
jgi:tRNA nucleotidyltransferase (CCA-adding enzyme)